MNKLPPNNVGCRIEWLCPPPVFSVVKEWLWDGSVIFAVKEWVCPVSVTEWVCDPAVDVFKSWGVFEYPPEEFLQINWLLYW